MTLLEEINEGLNPNWDGVVQYADQDIFALPHVADAPEIVTDRLGYETIHNLLKTGDGAN